MRNKYPVGSADHCRDPPRLIPFLVAIPFSTRDGALLVDTALFKSLMIVTGSVTAATLMIWFFSIVNGSYTREAVITGVCWLVLN